MVKKNHELLMEIAQTHFSKAAGVNENTSIRSSKQRLLQELSPRQESAMKKGRLRRISAYDEQERLHS